MRALASIRRRPVTLLLLLLCSCARPTTLASRGPYSPNGGGTEGLRYHPPRDLLIVEAFVTTRSTREWAWKGPGTCEPGPLVTKWQQTIATITPFTAPDPAMVFRLGTEPSRRIEQTLKVTVSEDGLLTALNYTSKDQAMEVAAGALKVVAGIAGLAAGIPAVGGLTVATADVGGYFDKRQFKNLGRSVPDSVSLRKRPLTDAFCWAISDENGKELLAKEYALQFSLVAAQLDRDSLLRKSLGATNESDAKKFVAMDDLQARRVAGITSMLEAVRTAIAAGASSSGHAAKQGVGKRDTTIRHTLTLDLSAIPTLAGNFKVSEAKSRLRTTKRPSPPYAAFVDSTHVFVTLDSVPATAATIPAGREATDSTSIGCLNVGADRCASIFFRSPRLRVVNVYVAAAAGDTALMVLRESSIRNLISSEDPLLRIDVASKRMATVVTGLTFGRRGTVTGLDQTTPAASASAVTGLANALSGARTEFQAGLSSVQSAQTSLDAMRQASRTSQIKELQDQKTLIDAQLALQGTTASRDLLLQKAQLDAQLGLLQSQQSLETAQIKAETAAAVTALKAEIEHLQAQIDLLKKQLELEAARKPDSN